jgi:hypothetical protein
MIVHAALCPSPPLLAPGVTGQDILLPELRDACAAAVAWLLAAGPDMVTVIGPATATATWPPDRVPDLSMHAPTAYPGPSPLPLALAIGAQLLDAADYSGPRILQSVAESASPAACLELGRELAADARRIALLVMGDGSARRSAAAPGYLDGRAQPFDAAVEQAFREGDLSALAALDPDLARDLLASGRPAWQALAGALSPALRAAPSRSRAVSAPVGSTRATASPIPGGSSAVAHPRTEILYSAAPFGVAYLVATLTPAPAPT